MELENAIKELLNSCVTALVDNEGDVVIEVSHEGEPGSESGFVVMANINVNPDDVGKIIGRQGRTIKSLRTLSRALGAKHNARVEVEIVEEDKE